MVVTCPECQAEFTVDLAARCVIDHHPDGTHTLNQIVGGPAFGSFR